ncbi:hypothetical protein [Streptomyces clavifer]|uniref:hypothetical protein n=1 Tax=Streptomyces clavifer TaxID=68188 RepID=UPI0036672184
MRDTRREETERGEDATGAVRWDAVPGHPEWYEPDRVAEGLRVLAAATNRVQAARAGSLLGCGGIVHDHGGAVFPAAAAAAPLLLDIAQHGHAAARDTVLGLLDEALSFVPQPGYTRVATPHGEAVRICCAVAHHVRSRSGFLAGLGRTGKLLLADAAAHWRFDVQECVADGDDTIAFGWLSGHLPGGTHVAELHGDGTVSELRAVTLAYPTGWDGRENCLRVVGRSPRELPPGVRLFPARCGEEPRG